MFLAAAASLLVAAAPDSPRPEAAPTYADLADLALKAPIVAQVRIKRSAALQPGEGGAVPAGVTRYLVTADVMSLIRASEGLPTEISYLADVRNVGGRAAKLAKKAQYLVLAAPVPGRPAELRLVAPDAQLPYSQAAADMIRSIVRESIAKDAPPRIVGIGKAFHVPGSIPGESETQIFLQTEDRRPISLSILRRPGETPSWAVALTEVTDEAAAPPRPNTLLWYRLACTLPARLPEQSWADEPENAAAIQSDYQLVIQGLGPCQRART